MDAYVAAFPATDHGYRMRIGNSQHKSSAVSHYECYQSGYPSGKPSLVGTTKSARIGYPDVKPRKKPKDPKDLPILAPGVSLDDEDSLDGVHDNHNTLENDSSTSIQQACPDNSYNHLHMAKSLLVTPPPQPNYAIKTELKSLQMIDTTISQLRAKLCAIASDRRHDVLMKIQTIIGNERIIADEGKLPISFLPKAPKAPAPRISQQGPDPLRLIARPGPAGTALSKKSIVDRLIEEFCGASELTTSTFNFEDLILSQPTLEPPQQIDTKNPTLTDVPSSTTSLDTQSKGKTAEPIELQPVNTKTNPSAVLPHKPVTLTLAPSHQVGITPITLTQTSPSSIASRPVTRKRTREADLLQRPTLINPNLPALLKKYQIHQWLEPFVINAREVKGDGHCGFRAIAISIGESQDEWLSVRQRMADTVTNTVDDRPLPENRGAAMARLLTSKPNVVNEQQHWLGMPSWGGIIANTFNRPVLYYKPGAYSQMVFPYSTPYNLNPPIVLAWANQHFVSLLLDFTRPNFPAPRVCATWRRFHKTEASSWLDAWQHSIESHAQYMKILSFSDLSNVLSNVQSSNALFAKLLCFLRAAVTVIWKLTQLNFIKSGIKLIELTCHEATGLLVSSGFTIYVPFGNINIPIGQDNKQADTPFPRSIMTSCRIIRGVNERSRQPKPCTPLQQQLAKHRKRDLEHAEASNAAMLRRLKQENQPRPLLDDMVAENIPAADEALDEPGDAEDNLDLNRFLPGEAHENVGGDADDPMSAALQRETHLADQLAHEKKWTWQYAIMLPTFLRTRLKTSNWGNPLNWNANLRPPCNCTMKTERDVDLVDLLCELGGLDALTQTGTNNGLPRCVPLAAAHCVLAASDGASPLSQNPAHTAEYFQTQWDRQRALQLKAISVKSKEKRERLGVLLTLEEDLLEARQGFLQKLTDINAANAPIRTAEQRHELLDLPASLVALETKVQELADELGNAELLTARQGTTNRVKAILSVQVALGFLYEAAVDAIQQKADAARKTGGVRLAEWNSVHSGLAKRTCRLWALWDRGLMEVVESTADFVKGRAEDDNTLHQEWADEEANDIGNMELEDGIDGHEEKVVKHRECSS
ncbi:uncharacterized protein MELLADRAFT_105774 [Melampsora larici-populina 98AG31]|uniref:OTU domain-containing protein n=1 Tax=Melampsora larici-populina (strain 98AG31 / pathotype 3-4-7) TaxID=747676 RepID=F4RJA2_MELLP|nr:uncharacterized protein MELLADRAFT_105774 [Melampsora larici-populina 98AG31]EGG07536.1 hypothetical protein MELLADRAFT_105774 [Melampsora larici-populina 98AG31]